MAYAQPQTMNPVINELEEVRAEFVTKVYQHVLLGVAAFVAFEIILFMTGIADAIYDIALSSQIAYIGIFALFMLGQGVASRAAHDLDNPTIQYSALFGSALLYALFFTLPLKRVFANGDSLVMPVIVTAVGFLGLTVIGMVTRNDLSFMRPIIMWASYAALGLIALSFLGLLNLGVWFSVAMIALSGGSILYQTQAVVRSYPAWAYVGAAVGLFSSLMTLFWYILRMFSRR